MAEKRILAQSHKGSDAEWAARDAPRDRQAPAWLLRDYDRCLRQHIRCASNHVSRASSHVRKNVVGAVAPARRGRAGAAAEILDSEGGESVWCAAFVSFVSLCENPLCPPPRDGGLHKNTGLPAPWSMESNARLVRKRSRRVATFVRILLVSSAIHRPKALLSTPLYVATAFVAACRRNSARLNPLIPHAATNKTAPATTIAAPIEHLSQTPRCNPSTALTAA
jgi:hypothetical protein